ncbi:MAG: FAD:protein FMN transferase [Bryobacteraceae bacterium]|nr:FAD:protein FMN transferase [Bryobacteraceae bacterium]
MGTTWQATAYATPACAARHEAIGQGILERLDSVVRQMSHYDPDSDLSRYNLAPAETWVMLPGALFRVLRVSLELAAATCGWFDPTLGRLIQLWGHGPEPAPGLPDEAALSAAVDRCGWQKLRLDAARKAAWQPGGLELNLGGIAKGFAVDAVAAWLRRCGVAAALVEIGGELSGFGVKPDGLPWWVALEAPLHASGSTAETVLALHECAVATSGDWVQRRWLGSRSVSHLIDPTRGAPIDGPVAGATVIHESAMAADAWATALCVAPLRTAKRLADAHGLAARLLFQGETGKLQEWLSPAMRAMAD